MAGGLILEIANTFASDIFTAFGASRCTINKLFELIDRSQKKYRMDRFLKSAYEEALQGLKEGGIPIGSIIEYEGSILGRGHNQRVQQGSVVLHAEMAALENAGRQSLEVYKDCTIYTTLSPCSMCSGAILLYGIKKVIIGENRNFMGSESYLKENGVEVEVINSRECISMMKEFIAKNEALWFEDIGE